MYRDFFEEIVVQLEVGQIDKVATIAPRDVPRAFEFVGNGRRFRHQLSAAPTAAPAIDQYCFLIRHRHYQFTTSPDSFFLPTLSVETRLAASPPQHGSQGKPHLNCRSH